MISNVYSTIKLTIEPSDKVDKNDSSEVVTESKYNHRTSSCSNDMRRDRYRCRNGWTQ